MDNLAQNLAEMLVLGLKKMDTTKEAEELLFLLETPPDPKMGDYAFPCFSLAKELRMSPKKIAEKLFLALEEELNQALWLEKAQVLGGYVNFRVSCLWMAFKSFPDIFSGAFFSLEKNLSEKKNIVLEYSQPNTHKAFHVGHMRNVALGDSLARILSQLGHEVFPVNYIGDIGSHVAKCLWGYERREEKEAPKGLPLGEWLGQIYTEAEQALVKQEDQRQEVAEILVALEAGEEKWQKLWKETRAWSLEAFEEVYSWLGARFVEVFYESEVEQEGKELVQKGFSEGVFVASQGALGADLEEEGLGFFLLLKSDGASLYATKDLALAQEKAKRYQADQFIYVVGEEQKLYFRQLFATLKKMGYPFADKCLHMPYGLVALKEGKMSSRKGNVILFSQLRDQMGAYIEENYLKQHRGAWEDKEIEAVKHKLAVSALRYGMVKQDPQRPIVFDMKEWLVSEGDTGIYLCYTYARIKSILRKAESTDKCLTKEALQELSKETEKEVIRALYAFPQTVEQAGLQAKPSILARYAFRLSQKLNRAYPHSPVFGADNPLQKGARLALFEASALVLAKSMELLGLSCPERM